MTYEDLKELGWMYEWKDEPFGKIHMQSEGFFIKEEECRWIMSIYLTREDDYLVMIKYVDKSVTFNEWENSECHFYGNIKTKEDLKMIMRFLAIID